MTRARAKALQDKVNSLLITLDLGASLDGVLFTSGTLCVIRYIPQESQPGIQDAETQPRQEEEEEATTLGSVLPATITGTTAPDEPAPETTAEGQASGQRGPGTTGSDEAVLPGSWYYRTSCNGATETAKPRKVFS